MDIILKMALPVTIFGIACAFWGIVVGSAYAVLPKTEGTLMWCRANNMMAQPICAPYSMKKGR